MRHVKMPVLMLFLLLVMLSACVDSSNPIDKPTDTITKSDPTTILPVKKTGWHLIDSYFQTPDSLSYVSSTMNAEKMLTSLTFLDETEGAVRLFIEIRWTEGFHGNQVIQNLEGIYHWYLSSTFIQAGESLGLIMKIENLIQNTSYFATATHTFIYQNEKVASDHIYPLNEEGIGSNYAYVRANEYQTIKTRPFAKGEVGDKISVRISLGNGLLGDIYWFYTFEWQDHDQEKNSK